MSHDQRPGRMRVVADPAAADRHRGNATTIDGSAETVAVANGGTALAAAGGAASAKGLPLLPAGLFLIACAAAGVLVAVLRPLGLG